MPRVNHTHIHPTNCPGRRLFFRRPETVIIQKPAPTVFNFWRKAPQTQVHHHHHTSTWSSFWGARQPVHVHHHSIAEPLTETQSKILATVAAITFLAIITACIFVPLLAGVASVASFSTFGASSVVVFSSGACIYYYDAY